MCFEDDEYAIAARKIKNKNMNHFYTFAALAILIAVAFQIFVSQFKPTKYWWIRKLRLNKIFPSKFDAVDDMDIREVEALLNFLIMHRCSDENGIVQEVRNGYVLKFYPEGVLKNKRAWEFDYVEIYDTDVFATLRVGFDSNGVPKYQIEHRQTHESTLRMFFKCRQGNRRELDEYLRDRNGRIKVMENYRDYVIKDVL